MQREKFWMRLLLFCCQLSLDVAGVIETDLNSGPCFKRCHWKPDWITDQDWLFFWTEIWIVARDPSQCEQSWIRKFLCCCQWSLNVVGVIWNSLSESCFYILVGISIVSNQHKLYRNLNNGTSSMHAEQFWMRLLLFFSRMISLCRRFSEIDKNSGSFSSTVSEDLTKCPIRIGSSSIFRCMRTSMLLETKYSVRCFRSYINNLLFWKQYGSVLLSF